jgi:2-polyprenyl-6-methoxyphenol hydroxylase-like FAD-dependent oxidoreductase
LARELLQAHGHSRDPGDAHALQRFERLHRLACRPIFDATNAIVGLYTRDDAIARLARPALLRAAGRLPMIRRGVGTLLAQH